MLIVNMDPFLPFFFFIIPPHNPFFFEGGSVKLWPNSTAPALASPEESPPLKRRRPHRDLKGHYNWHFLAPPFIFELHRRWPQGVCVCVCVLGVGCTGTGGGPPAVWPRPIMTLTWCHRQILLIMGTIQPSPARCNQISPSLFGFSIISSRRGSLSTKERS